MKIRDTVFFGFSIIILLVLGSNVFADTIDVVYLKNGSIIRGMVVETIPNSAKNSMTKAKDSL